MLPGFNQLYAFLSLFHHYIRFEFANFSTF
jgi:hypothetical protein